MHSCDHVDVPLCVRYAETDQMGRAYYANYFVWFEVGRTSYCKARGFSYAELERQTGTFLPVVETVCRYHRSLGYDDQFIVRTSVTEFRSRAMTFEYQVLDGEGRLVASGSTRHLFTAANGRPKAFPREYRSYLASETGGSRGFDADSTEV
jgi:acyl-CoA thioester hydrolase